MSIKDLVTNIKRNGLLASMHQLEELYRLAIESEEKLAVSQREFRAADATIENLQMQVEKLAAESAVLLALMNEQAGSFSAALAEGFHEAVMESGSNQLIDIYQRRLQPAIQCIPPTPATDYFLAEVRASAVDEICLKISNSIVNCYQDELVGLDEAANICGDYASEIRKGAQS